MRMVTISHKQLKYIYFFFFYSQAFTKKGLSGMLNLPPNFSSLAMRPTWALLYKIEVTGNGKHKGTSWIMAQLLLDMKLQLF